MNRNTQAHFAELPTVNIGRSKFDRSFTHTTTFNTGELVPVYVDLDIVPGDTVSMKQSEIVRMMTPICPVMDNAFMDFYWFFVPNRLVWDNFKKFMGENDTAPWTQTVDRQVPQIVAGNNAKYNDKLTNTVVKGSVLDHMGIPTMNDWTYTSTLTKIQRISSLPTKAYSLIWNEFFRDENLQNPVNITKTDANGTIINENSQAYISDPDAAQVSYAQYGGLPCLKVCKPHDYFTSALPGPQKGPAVALPLSTTKLPVRYNQIKGDSQETWDGKIAGFAAGPFQNQNSSGTNINSYNGNTDIRGEAAYTDETYTTHYNAPAGSLLDGGVVSLKEFGLMTDLSEATGATVTALRQAFAIQKYYERDARGGTRYIESVKSHFGVTNPDFRMQRPEYLGGFRQNINMNQVVQSSPVIESEETTPLGTTGAYSVTTHQNSDVFTHSFTEHGILMGLCCIRTEHTYQQGINRAWFKKNRLDFYSPEFANLSEQAILNREIYAQGNTVDEQAFGYQEAWAEMRYMPNIVSGEIRSNYSKSLDIWTYADYYETKPTLGDKWIKETSENVARTLAIQDQDQFMGDFYFGAVYTRPMPLYSIPGLIDHH